MAKRKFNHDLSNAMEACGLNEVKLSSKFEDVVENKIQNDDEVDSHSKITEVLENNFKKRELSFILASKMLSEARRARINSDPLAELKEKLRG